MLINGQAGNSLPHAKHSSVLKENNEEIQTSIAVTSKEKVDLKVEPCAIILCTSAFLQVGGKRGTQKTPSIDRKDIIASKPLIANTISFIISYNKISELLSVRLVIKSFS